LGRILTAGLTARKPGFPGFESGKPLRLFQKTPSRPTAKRQFCLGWDMKARLNKAKYQLTMFSPYGSLLSDGSEDAAFLKALASCSSLPGFTRLRFFGRLIHPEKLVFV
jgi:hypothetical protein